MTSIKIDRLQEKIDFLSQKNEALTLEVSHLLELNSKLQSDLELSNKTTESLKNQLSHLSTNNTESTLNLKALCANNNAHGTFSFNPKDEDTTLQEFNTDLIPSHLKDHYDEAGKESMVRNALRYSLQRKENSSDSNNISSPTFASSTQATPQNSEKKAKQGEYKLQEPSEAEKLLHSLLESPDKFFDMNNIMKLGPYSPQTKMNISQIEKNIEGIESTMKNWTKSLKEMNKSCSLYTKTIESFADQLLADKEAFGSNQELSNLLSLISQSLRGHFVYLNMFTRVIENSIYTPLKSLYKETTPSYKEPKKKFQKTLEELEVHQHKYLVLKRTSLFKDPVGGQNLLKNYTNALRNFEISRLEYLQSLNGINMKINLELSDKFCMFFKSKMAFLTSSIDTLVGLEDPINLYANTVMKKQELRNELNKEFGKVREDIEKNVYIKYPARSSEGILKEGYLFTRTENKELKKKYCIIKEDGTFGWQKESENSSETAELEEITNLKLCNVKENNDSEYLSCFELVSALMKKPIVLQTDCESSMQEWIATIRNTIEKLLCAAPHGKDKEEQKKITVQTKNSKLKEVESTSPFRLAKSQLIAQIIENNVCADCGNTSPSWISLNLGIIICIECSGIHRRLGPSISKVRSLKLDNLSWNVLELFSKLHTTGVNKIWEGLLDEDSGDKIRPKADNEKREAYIRRKYIEKAFVWPLKGDDITEICKAIKEKNIREVLNVIAYTSKNLNQLYKIEGKEQTVLHYASMHSSKEIVELLLRNGCNIEIHDEDECKPLERALIANNIEVIQILANKLEDMEF